jgi:hypothetical protein
VDLKRRIAACQRSGGADMIEVDVGEHEVTEVVDLEPGSSLTSSSAPRQLEGPQSTSAGSSPPRTYIAITRRRLT